MALKSYVVTRDFATPYVTSSSRGDRPTDIRLKKFKKGDIINGELKHANNKPAFVMVQGTLVVPLHVIKEIVTKEVVSNASGSSLQDTNKSPVSKAIAKTASKAAYFDAIVIGGLLGAVGVYIAEKKKWIEVADKKNKLYGAIVGASLGCYVVYRMKIAKKNASKE